MINDGLFEQFPCDAVFGMHNWPGLGEGHFGLTSGPMMASSNEFSIEIQGKGGHAALPHNSADPVMAGVHPIIFMFLDNNPTSVMSLTYFPSKVSIAL
jgi:hippurate hydrolase